MFPTEIASIKHLINKAMHYLHQNQLKYGEFRSWASPNPDMTVMRLNSELAEVADFLRNPRSYLPPVI